MSSEEWIVEVDSDDKVLGKVEREAAHDQNNLKLHREVMCLLYTDSAYEQFLLQHRSIHKNQFPGMWTLSATGHVGYEDLSRQDQDGYVTASRREAKEELGVKAKNLQLVGKRLQELPVNVAMMGIVTGEYEGELRVDPLEVSEVRIFDKISLLEISDKLTPGAKACLEFLEILKK